MQKDYLVFQDSALQSGALANTTASGITITVNSSASGSVNNYIFGMMTENYLEKWNTHEAQFVKLVNNLGITHFQYPGGSISYWWHYDPNGAGYGIKESEYTGFRHGKSGAANENFLNKFIDMCKATNANAIFVANFLTGNPDELDGAIDQTQRSGVKVVEVILGVELHIPAVQDKISLQQYLDRAQKYIAMLRSKYPSIKIYADGAPVHRAANNQYFQQWNSAVSKLQGIDGMVQYQWWWPSYGGVSQQDQFSHGLDDLKSFMSQLDNVNAALGSYSNHWVIDQWGIKEEAKPVYGGTMLQMLHLVWYPLYVTDYNYHHPGFYQTVEYMKLGSNYVQDLIKLNNNKNQGAGYHLNPAYYAVKFASVIKDSKYAPATVNGSKDIKAYYFEKNNRKYLFVINLTADAANLPGVTVNGNLLNATLVQAYWSDKLSSDVSGINSSTGGSLINPYSVSYYELK